MLDSGVLKFGEFTTKSGRQTPYFVNTGNYKTGRQAGVLGKFYANVINENLKGKIDFLYGPAYKGIPLAVSAAIALDYEYGFNLPYAFNRKEIKDHGEGGSLIGYTPKNGDRALIIEDVITAGTSVRESVPILKSYGDISVSDMVISVDRMEKGQSDKTAVQEVKDEFGINVFSIVTIKDILELLYNKEVNGRVIVDDNMKLKIEAYMDKYCI
ncbi:MAG: orotate phosphoribosyltransferase [Clostridiales bacterium]|nr:orotate phosphoribosyltransferase [Clostridiales bacterium]